MIRVHSNNRGTSITSPIPAEFLVLFLGLVLSVVFGLAGSAGCRAGYKAGRIISDSDNAATAIRARETERRRHDEACRKGSVDGTPLISECEMQACEGLK